MSFSTRNVILVHNGSFSRSSLSASNTLQSPHLILIHISLSPSSSHHPSTPFPRRPHLEDARTKIIQKNRAKITDVRDLISSKKRPADARYVITKNMTDRLGKMGAAMLPGHVAGGGGGGGRHRQMSIPDPYMLDAAFALDDLIPPLKYSPTKQHSRYRAEYRDLMEPVPPPNRRRPAYHDYDAIEDTQPLDSSRGAPSYDLLYNDDYRSVKQAPPSRMPPLSYKPAAPLDMDNEDAFDLYEAVGRDRRPLPPPPSNLRRYVPNDESHLSYEMRSRLEGNQAASKSMGIFANPTKSLTSDKHSATRGFRVMVTNLHSSVTVWDIQELFGDIGGLLSAVISKPGVAEVIYKTVKDAEDAVEVYHNRQLDGQPMKCHLITPPPTLLQPERNSVRKPPLELDLDTLHSALFTSRRH